MRRAVQESYRHQDQTEGLEWARAVLANACNSPRKRSTYFESFPAPNSGYVNRKSERKFPLQHSSAVKSEHFEGGVRDDGDSYEFPHHDTSTPVYRTYGFTPGRADSFRPSLLPSARPISLFPQKKDSSPESPRKFGNSRNSGVHNMLLRERQKAEIQRRLSPHSRSLSHVLVTPVRFHRNSKSEDDKAGSSRCVDGSYKALPNSGLVETLCKNLDDLENSDCVIKKDGTILPIRKLS